MQWFSLRPMSMSTGQDIMIFTVEDKDDNSFSRTHTLHPNRSSINLSLETICLPYIKKNRKIIKVLKEKIPKKNWKQLVPGLGLVMNQVKLPWVKMQCQILNGSGLGDILVEVHSVNFTKYSAVFTQVLGWFVSITWSLDILHEKGFSPFFFQIERVHFMVEI